MRVSIFYLEDPIMNTLTIDTNVPPVEDSEGADKKKGEEDVEHEQQLGHRVRNKWCLF